MRQGGHMLQHELKEIKRGWTELCHTRNQTKNKKMSPPNLHTAAVYVTSRNFLNSLLNDISFNIPGKDDCIFQKLNFFGGGIIIFTKKFPQVFVFFNW